MTAAAGDGGPYDGFFERHPGLRLVALGAGGNAPLLDLRPFGRRAEFLDAARSPGWVARYHRANQLAFGGPLALPGWVLVDCYLMPGAVGLLAARGRDLPAAVSGALGASDDDEVVAAGYCAVPCLEPGVVMGVSLFSHLPGVGAAGVIKALTLRMLGARAQRGIAQWSSPSLRAHTRLGPLRLEGPVPGAHGKADESFVYRLELAPAESPPRAPPGGRGRSDRWVPLAPLAALRALLERAAGGERVEIVAPGLSGDGASVLVREGVETPP